MNFWESPVTSPQLQDSKNVTSCWRATNFVLSARSNNSNIRMTNGKRLTFPGYQSQGEPVISNK